MIRLFFILITILTLSCNSNKPVFEENPPFTLLEATYQNWTGGVEESGRGIHVELIFAEIQLEANVENIYFRGQKLNFIQDKNDSKTFRASYTFPTKEDVILDSESVKELNNPIPALDSNFPFQLKTDEAVIAYAKSDKTYHYKLTLTEKEDIAYPSLKPVDNN